MNEGFPPILGFARLSFGLFGGVVVLASHG